MEHDYEQAATVEVMLKDGETIRLSAILKRDPHYLTWNRLRLLGTETDQFNLWRLEDEHGLRWSLFANANWPMKSTYETCGRGFPQRGTRLTRGALRIG